MDIHTLSDKPGSAGVAHNSESTVSQQGKTAQGHRGRLLERFLKSGTAGFHNYEIIEFLLSFAIPRKDTKPIARELWNRYGSLSAIFNAPYDELLETKGLGTRSAALFPFVKEIMALCLKEKYDQKPVISHRRDVEEYFRFNFGHKRDEYVGALFLDSANHILQTDILSEGTVNQCAVYPRVVIEKAMRCGAASFILAHNHPAGGLNPSEADWVITERLFTIGKLLEIPLLDHIIISKTKVVSLRECSRWPR
ncbi:DNA repair protein RadC [Chitinispirillales bacterium ANBcel5]|uniref:RadC family protein n=1 Tax=Cellulosispirillum alkaliphilum TaxID=3039283 RepID=UPI002A4F4542|nr:DNA repair protein RadC [Chitinispirillales bacterium ANBcel5]